MDLIVKHTNEKIEADFIEKAYSAETLRKAPHIAYTDEVGFFPFWYKFSNIFCYNNCFFYWKGWEKTIFYGAIDIW